LKSVVIATEDELSEAVAKRLVAEHPDTLSISPYLFGRKGFGYLKTKLQTFCEIARRQPVLLITDLDAEVCAPALVMKWRGKSRFPAGLLFRVAVREVESWLIADHEAIGRLLQRQARLPDQPDSLRDPKQTLLTLASKAPRAVRQEICAENGALTRQGLGYNRNLGGFAKNDWSPARAAARSDSLRRARRRLEELAGGRVPGG